MQMNLAQTVGTLTLLGDESRVRLCALLRDRELSVGDLVRVTGISQSRVSTHLARLREAGFVRDRRDGSHAFYALATEALSPTAKSLLDAATNAADPTLEGDRERLLALDGEQCGAVPDPFAGEMDRHYSPGRTWQSLAAGLASLIDLGDVLDVGCGDGAVAAYLAPHCQNLTCIDVSPRMATAAGKRLSRHENARAIVADGEKMPFRAGSFDAAIVFHTLTHAENPSAVLAECARVLAPGGRIVVLSLDEHQAQDVTLPFGERHPGFSPRALRGMLLRSSLSVTFSDIVSREAKKPHFRVVLGTALKPRMAPRASSKTKKSG